MRFAGIVDESFPLIIAKTGNIAAVQRQLGHRQATYAMQYARTTTEALAQVLDDR